MTKVCRLDMFSNSMSGQTMGRPEVLLLSDLHTLLLTAPKKGSKSRCNQNSSSKLDCTMCSSLAQRANQYMCKYQSFAGGLLRSPKVNVLKVINQYCMSRSTYISLQ